MTAKANKKSHGFKSEARQLLHLMIHSLYSNREVFVRELISNASDAADKLRFAALADDSLLGDDPDLAVTVDIDREARIIRISDNGIGMTRKEVIDNLGTIAKSGTAQFLESLTGDAKKDSLLIGQFGVGFYSAFIVADRVEVETRKADAKPAQGVRWTSTGEDEFDVETIDRPQRGTAVTLHLRSDADEFLDDYRLRAIIRKYADHISLPVRMKKPASATDTADTDTEDTQLPQDEYETVNTARALWTRPRSELKDDEYKSFYKHISHDFQDPLRWSHNKVEGKLEYTSLLYLPAKAPFDLWHREATRGLKLYVQRVFIMDHAEQFLPLYLRFVKGVVDSNDLSLNISREALQNDPAVETMRSALTRRVLDMLEKMAQNDADAYRTFWDEFGQVLKEGPGEDAANGERIAKLLRFSTTHTDAPVQDQSLADYISRMTEGQQHIYYVAADTFKTATRSPHLEVFRKRGIEVLLLHDRIDEWLVGHLGEFDGKSFQDVARGELDLPGEAPADEAEEKEAREQAAPLLERIKTLLGDQVEDVRTTQRLTDSPACLVVGQHDLGMQMRRILEAAGQTAPAAKRIFEINADHPLVRRLQTEQNENRFRDLALVLFDQASLAEGTTLEDPASYIQRLNALLLEIPVPADPVADTAVPATDTADP